MRILGATQFDQCVLNISLINLCNQQSYVGQEMRRRYLAWNDEADEPTRDPWHDLHQFTLYVPHPEQQYEGITLEYGLSQGYNIEVDRVEDSSQVPYKIPPGGHFVIVLKQKGLDDGFQLAATGIFVRPLALLSLDLIEEMEAAKYQPVVVKHPIIREYPSDWQRQLQRFLNNEIRGEELPNVVGFVDQATNRDYRPPSWDEVSLAAKGFAGV